ncbi:MAG: hypothetical protein IPM42_05390 [Saprospiraceae bacterium]|nr:hypothetical protein [Saprospiraceae bacterium]
MKILKFLIPGTFILALAVSTISCSKDEKCVAVLDPNCICTADFNPVCGCDKITYSNACVAACNGIEVVSTGECPK